MHRDHGRKLTHRDRFRDVSHIKLMDIVKTLRHRRLRRDVSRTYSSTHSQGFPPPLANYDSPERPPSSHISRYRSYAASIRSVTGEDCSSGMSTSSSIPDTILSDVDRRRYFPLHPISTFPTSPSVFQLRSASTKDYLVAQLEQDLGRLQLRDVGSPDHVPPFKNSSCDTSMDVSPQRTVDRKMSSRRALSERNAQNAMPSPHDQNVVPMILITSVDAKHPKPLPPSDQRPSRTPFGSSNLVNHPNVSRAGSEQKTKMLLHDDPFTTQRGPHHAAYPPANDLTFHLPSVPLTGEQSTYAPETPTPMCCDHGDCSGDLWEILHPPLVLGRFTLPPFTLPPLSPGLFTDLS